MQSIKFVGEQFAGRKVRDLCPFDPTKKYVFSINSCGEMLFEEINSFFAQVPGFVAGSVQNLTHDANGNLLRA